MTKFTTTMATAPRLLPPCLRPHLLLSSGLLFWLIIIMDGRSGVGVVVSARVSEKNCNRGFYYQPFTAECVECNDCPPGKEPREACDGYTTSQTVCRPCPSGYYKDEWSVDKCKKHTVCPQMGFPTLSIGNSSHDTICKSTCLTGYFKPKGISSWCIICTEAYARVSECGKYFSERNSSASQLPSPDERPTDASVNESSSPGGNSDADQDNIDGQLPEVEGGPDQKSLGLIAAVVTSSIVISALFVVLILCCVCRSNRRSSGANGGTGLGSSNSRHSGGRRHMRGVAVVGGGSHRQSSGAIGSVGQGSGKCQQNYSEGQRADQNSMSDYEVSPHCSLCCLSLRCRSLKRTEDSSSSDANYCIKDSSFVFKNGKSLELSEFNQYTISSEKLSPTFDNYSIHGCSKNTTSNKSNTSQPSTLKSLQNQKISQLNCTIEDYASLTQATAATAIPGAHDYAPLHKSSTLNNQNSFETSLDEDSAAAAAGGDLGVNGQQLHTTTIQPELETPYLPSNTVRLSRQDSEKRREADRIQKAQENAFKLRHVSPVRLRSASETIFGTNSGKETILDLLQSKEPEEVLALKIELISQIYESLKLSDLSSDIVKEMTLEMEKVSQFVSLNLGRAFIDNFDLKIKAKSVTCAQLLAKVFKHKGSQISVSQFLHFLHQFGDRQVAEAYCDLLIRWYRHETSRHRMTGQFMQQNQAYSSEAATLTNDTTTLNPAYAMSLGSSFAGSHTASAQLGYGTPGVSHNRHHMMAPMSRHSLAVPTNVQVQPFSSQQRHSLNQQQIQGIPNSSQVMSMATEGGGGGGDTKYNSLFKQQQHEQKLHPMQLSSNAFNVQQQHNNHQFTPTNNTVGTNVPGHHHFMQQQQQHPNSLPLHQSLHYALTDVPVHGFRGQAQAIQLGVQGGGGVMTPPSAQQGMLQPQQRFMPQEEMNSECGEDDVFA